MKITIAKVIFLALTLILIPSTTAAKGPDRVTPAEEYVCDGHTGKAYGLCNAYCEAMDCDSPDRKASPKACAQTLANYQKLMDVKPPCYAPVNAAACPCFGDLDVLFNGTSSPSCSPDENPTLISDASSGTLVQAVALLKLEFYACIGVDGQLQTISLDEANGCVSMIEGFCAP